MSESLTKSSSELPTSQSMKSVVPARKEKPPELHEKLDEVDLTRLYQIFSREKGRKLNCENLKRVLFAVAKVAFRDEDFDIIFMKMNIKRDGYVTWDDFVSYLILGFHQQEIKAEFETLENPIPVNPRMLKSNHRYTINRITFCPTVHLDRTYNWQDGSLMTCSRDGTINYWSLDWQFERSVKSTCPNLKVQQTWVTDMIALPDVSVVCTSSSERDLRFYDTSARKFELRVIFTMIENAVTAMHYYFSEDANEESKLILGDMRGCIHVIFIQSIDRGPFRSKLGLPLLDVRYEKVLKGVVEGFRAFMYRNQHTDFVRQIQYYPALNTIISCAECPLRGLIMRDLSETKQGYVYQTAKGSWCFTVTQKVMYLVNGGADCLVRVWNPFVSHHPVANLYGHRTGVVSMIIQDNGKRLYSLSQDKCIKVWDVAGQTCLQNYLGLPTGLGEHSDMTTLYNPESRQWFIGSTMLAVIPLSPKQSGEHTDGFTHTSGVSVVLYNPLFKIVVTCGLDSFIIVWDPWEGRRMIAVKEAHTKSIHAEVVPIEITAAAFDPGYQRLITGAHDGTLKIWNFNTGTCLRNLKLDQESEIKSIIWVNNRILAMGWNRCVTEFSDNATAVAAGGELSKNWEGRHAEDISFATVRVPQTLVTCTYDGELIMWRLETGQPYKQYNVSDPTSRIKIQFQPPKRKDMRRKDTKDSKMKTKPQDKPKDQRTATRKSIVQSLVKPMVTTPAAGAGATRTRRVSTIEIPESCIPIRKLAVHSMIFLCARPMEPKIGTLLVAVENGNIQVWSHHINGGFITSFTAIHKAGDYVISMATDLNNEFLFTGTTIGYIKTWFLKNYIGPNDDEHVCMPRYRLMFPFMWNDLFIGRAARMARLQVKPMLFSCYKGHIMPVTGLVYLDEANILISCSADFTARMWTLGGRYIQTLGTFKGYKPVDINPKCNANFEHTIPPDIMRVASSTTLRVLRGGHTERQLTFKQLQAKVEKELTHIDYSKIYGVKMKDPILGRFYKPTDRTAQAHKIEFDTSFPHIPVYHHLIMPEALDVRMPPVKTTITTIEVEKQSRAEEK